MSQNWVFKINVFFSPSPFQMVPHPYPLSLKALLHRYNKLMCNLISSLLKLAATPNLALHLTPRQLKFLWISLLWCLSKQICIKMQQRKKNRSPISDDVRALSVELKDVMVSTNCCLSRPWQWKIQQYKAKKNFKKLKQEWPPAF